MGRKRKASTYQSYDDFSDEENKAPVTVVEHHIHSDFVSMSRIARRTIVETITPSTAVLPVHNPIEWDYTPVDISNLLHNDFSEQMNAESYQFWMDPTFAQYPETLEDLAPQGTRNRPSDHPLRVWSADRDTYLRECLRLEGRGAHNSEVCACGVSPALFRCTACLDPSIRCKGCIVQRHQGTPLHRIEEWTGSYFCRRSLASLGLRLRLGHRLGDHCVCCRSVNDFVIIAVDGLHVVNVDFCDCEQAETHPIQLLRARLFPATSSAPQTASTFEVLRLFQLLTFMSKCSAYEFYQSLSRLTENTGISSPPDRYKAFLCTIRQWRHIKLLKRFGRGHDSAGVMGTREGECAVLCPACPHPRINLPPDYSTQKDAWKYALFLGFDGNFRLKRLNVSNDELDPGLNEGFSFCVENRRYHEFLNSFQDLIEEQSTCNDHRAIKHAQTRSGINMGATGLATIDCSRHDMKRPCSLGDFQRGERQINIDYCLLSSLRHQTVTHLVLSYDIICQWGVKLKQRVEQYTTSYPDLGLSLAKALSARFLVPKYHLRAHRDYCKARFDFHLTPGVGMADGEAPERGWAAANGLANSTKEMGPGHRRDVLDDFFGDFNWRKTTTLASALCRKLEEAIPAASRHQVEFEQLTASLPPHLVREWGSQVVAWENTPNAPGVINPYDVIIQPITLAKVRKQLAEEEREELERGDQELSPELTPQGMIVQALEIEDLQYRQNRDRKRLGTNATPLQESKVIESANRLQRRIDGWIQAQQYYIPGAILARRRTPPVNDPADIPLFLPSACLSQKIRVSESLLRIEFRLRIAEANDALASLRSCLLTRDRMWKFKDAHIRGQRESGRANSTIQSVNERIDAEANRYRRARAALVSLSIPLTEQSWKEKLRPLSDVDVKGLKWKDNEIRATEESESRRSLPWIWKTEGVVVGDDPQTDSNVNEALRIEWCRARARTLRWKEECTLLMEEMRRVQEFFKYQRDSWLARSKSLDWCDNASVREGLTAYAARQAGIRNSMLLICERLFASVEKPSKSVETV